MTPLRLIGGVAVRVLCPDFPPRIRNRQDLDLASTSAASPHLTELLMDLGCEPDRRFNAPYGHEQLCFASPRGRAVDVLVDGLEMCHVLDFRDRIERISVTIDVTDLLFSKLQIVERWSSRERTSPAVTFQEHQRDVHGPLADVCACAKSPAAFKR